MSKLTVTYIKHSGFLIETANSYLLFDYWQGKLPELQYDKELYIFSSHAHHDHYTINARESYMFYLPILKERAVSGKRQRMLFL